MWYAKVQVTDLSSVVHDVSPGVLESGDALKLNLDNEKADEFTFTFDEEGKLIEKHRQDAGKLWLVVEADGLIVGSVMFSTGPTRRLAHRGSLGMGVDRAWRGRGVGSLLMQHLLGWAEKEPSVEKVGLAVLATNEAAIRLYRKFGFVEEGRRPREIKMGPNEYVDDILMYRWVK